MRNNEELQKDVQAAIRWEPSLIASEIGVTTKNGVVTLTGKVDTYSNRVNAERATKNVVGVRAVNEDLTVSSAGVIAKSDSDIMKSVLDAWSNNWQIPKDKIKVTVEDGWVNLEGDVEWKYQEEAPEKALKNLLGLKGVTNLIKVHSDTNEVIEKQNVEKALRRNWSMGNNQVKVEVDENKVKLSGAVYSLYQKEEAERLAWNAPGVLSVENEVTVIY